MVKTRFEYIDSLRGLAIAGVMITHVGSILGLQGLAKAVTNIGSMGVQLFFVISAFTIFFSLSKSDGNSNQFRNFLIRRLFRIIPVYWFGIILYTLVYGLDSRGWREGPELWHYPYHIFLVNIWHPLTSSSVVPGGWSISCEVMFYLMVPVIYKYSKDKTSVIYFLIITMIILPVCNLYAQSLFINAYSPIYDKNTINTFFYRWIPNQLACFAFGLLLFNIQKKNRYAEKLKIRGLNLLLTIGATILIIGMMRYPLPWPLKHHVYAFLFMTLALLLSFRPWKLFVNRSTIFLGKISFSSYLVHFLVIKQLNNAIVLYFPRITENTSIHFGLLAVLTFLFTIPLAFLSYKYIELSAVDLGKKVIDNLDKRKAVTLQV